MPLRRDGASRPGLSAKWPAKSWAPCRDSSRKAAEDSSTHGTDLDPLAKLIVRPPSPTAFLFTTAPLLQPSKYRTAAPSRFMFNLRTDRHGCRQPRFCPPSRLQL